MEIILHFSGASEVLTPFFIVKLMSFKEVNPLGTTLAVSFSMEKLNKYKKVIAFLLSAPFMIFIGCAKDKNENRYGATNTGYYMNNGICMNNMGQQVSPTYCNGANSGYYMNNGICMNNMGQQVTPSLCMNNGGMGSYYYSNGSCYSSAGQMVPVNYCSNMGYNGYSQQCVGSYYWNGQMVQCNGSNCTGYSLVSVQSGQTVYCQ